MVRSGSVDPMLDEIDSILEEVVEEGAEDVAREVCPKNSLSTVKAIA